MTAPLLPRLATPDDSVAIRIEAATLSYRELAASAGAVVRALAGAERAAVWTTSSFETCVAVVGALAAGTTVIPINPTAGPRELEHLVADSAPGCVLASAGTELPASLSSIPRLPVTASHHGSVRFPDLLDPTATALILYTSGTTGPPKGVQIPRRAIESNLDALAKIWGWTSDDRVAHALPLFHVHGLVVGLLGALRRGGQIELVPKFSPHALANAIHEGASMVFGVPTMYHRIGLAAENDPELANAFRNARLLVSGSAALPASDHQRVHRLTGQAIVERYGLTETLMNLGVAAGDHVRPGYIGRPIPGVEVRLVDDDGEPLDLRDDTTFGEIVVRGPNLFTGYLNQPDATAEAMRNGWFFTGDLATMTADGIYRIVGRKATDLIKSGGYRIGAGEIESALLEHPAVAEAAVAGIADEDLGERIGAWVVLADPPAVTAGQLRDHVGKLLSLHKRPHTVFFVEELPRNALGKVTKSLLTRNADRPLKHPRGSQKENNHEHMDER